MDIFEQQVIRLKDQKPSCFGKYKETMPTQKFVCGTCWFSSFCKTGKLPKGAITALEKDDTKK